MDYANQATASLCKFGWFLEASYLATSNLGNSPEGCLLKLRSRPVVGLAHLSQMTRHALGAWVWQVPWPLFTSECYNGALVPRIEHPSFRPL